jgi:uncharacterized repeat protein (TIGR01451 family)
MSSPLFRLKKLLTSLLLACGLALGAWVWLSGLSGAPAPAAAAPAARPKLAVSPVTVTLVSSKDNMLVEVESVTDTLLSSGAGGNFFTGLTGQPSGQAIRRGLIAFDITSIPTQSQILSVTLKLHGTGPNAGLQTIALHSLLANWGEGASVSGMGGATGAPATPGDATWFHGFYSGTLWATPGGDFTLATSAATQVGAIGFYQWTGSQMVTDVQGWVNNPSTNFGWLLQGNESVSGSAKRFDSRETTTPANRPTLIVTYLPPGLTLTKQVSNANPIPGQVVTYTIVVSYSGQGAATGARVSDTLPSGITFAGPVTLNPSGAGIPGNSGTLPTLASNLTLTAGTRVTLSFPVSISFSLTPDTVLTNTVVITSNEVSTPVSSSVGLKVARPIYLPIIRKQS